MNTPTSGQRRHKPGHDRTTEIPEKWLAVRTEVLWRFAVDLVARHTLRRTARLVGLGVETVRCFVMRKGAPNLTTRRRFAELFLELHPEAAMERDDTRDWRARPRLITVLPHGQAEAREAVARLCALAREHALPLEPDELHAWLDLQVRAEYDAADHYDPIARGEREHTPGSSFAREPAKKRRPRERRAAAVGMMMEEREEAGV
jgi:hypothetical protein